MGQFIVACTHVQCSCATKYIQMEGKQHRPWYCKTLNICGIKFSRFNENDILAYLILAVMIYHGSSKDNLMFL